MAELITPEQPRIKFGLRRVGTHEVAEARASRELRALCELMLQMEAAGAAPVLNDGKVRRHFQGTSLCCGAVCSTGGPSDVT
jgi:hypothetical protein